MHYFYATNTPLVTIITTGILATPRGIEPRFMTSKAIVLPLDDRVLLVPVARLELARLSTPDPKSGVAAITPHRHGSSSRFRPYIVHVNSVSSLLFDYAGTLV